MEETLQTRERDSHIHVDTEEEDAFPSLSLFLGEQKYRESQRKGEKFPPLETHDITNVSRGERNNAAFPT